MAMPKVDYYVDRHKTGLETCKPYPGKSPFRWRVFDLTYGVDFYLGKPSRQILEKIRRMCTADINRMFQVYLMDKTGWFLVMSTRNDANGSVVYNSWVGPVMGKYSGLDYRIARARDIDAWFLKQYGRKGERDGVLGREAAVPQPAGR